MGHPYPYTKLKCFSVQKESSLNSWNFKFNCWRTLQ